MCPTDRQTDRQTHITERVTFVAVYDYIYEQYAMQPRNNFLRLQEFEKKSRPLEALASFTVRSF